MLPKVFVVVPCGKTKIWSLFPKNKAVRAEEAYIGPPFKVNKAFAKKFADRWMVLSAKYGFIEPDFLIPEDYDVSFNDVATNPISLSELQAQAIEKDLRSYNVVIVLGGKNYVEIVKKVFSGVKVIAPTVGLPIGKAAGYVVFLTKFDKVQMLKKIM